MLSCRDTSTTVFGNVLRSILFVRKFANPCTKKYETIFITVTYAFVKTNRNVFRVQIVHFSFQTSEMDLNVTRPKGIGRPKIYAKFHKELR